MPDQMTIAAFVLAKKKVTRRENVSAEMEAGVLWSRLIVPDYPKRSHKGRRPAVSLDVMLRFRHPEKWYSLSHPLSEESL